jgi:hypothetical protein
MLRFPSGVHDDIVDSLAWLTRMAMRITPPKPKKFKNATRKSWKTKLSSHTGATQGGNYMTA